MKNAAQAISVALQRRQEKVGSTASFSTDPMTFADNKQMIKIASPAWQIVYGRRGVGKTTLLANFARYITNNETDEKYCKSTSIELNSVEFTPAVHMQDNSQPPDELVAQVYFLYFIRRISSHLYDVFADRDKQSKFVRLFLKSDKKKYIEDLVEQIKLSAYKQIPTAFGAESKFTETSTESSDNSSTSKSEGGVNLTLGAPSVSANAKINTQVTLVGKKSSRVKSQVTIEKSLNAFLTNYQDTRNKVEELLTALGVDRLYIFIDEWSELDPDASSKVQPLFLSLIKKVFWKNPKFTIKIGAIRSQTRLNYRGKKTRIIGLESNADIFEIDLDEIYSTDEFDKSQFYEDLVFRHLAFCNNDLYEMQRKEIFEFYGVQYVRPIDTFINYIFKSRDAFENLISGSGSVPRDFIELFDSLAQSKQYSVTPPWSMREVKQAVHRHFVYHKHGINNLDEITHGILNKIMINVKKSQSSLIVLERTMTAKQRVAVIELYHRRLIHDVPQKEIPALLRNKFLFFYADFGLYYDVLREKIENINGDKVHKLLGSEVEPDIAQYLVQP